MSSFSTYNLSYAISYNDQSKNHKILYFILEECTTANSVRKGYMQQAKVLARRSIKKKWSHYKTIAVAMVSKNEIQGNEHISGKKSENKGLSFK